MIIDRFPKESVTWEIDRQFLWGPNLLISPVLEKVRKGITPFLLYYESVKRV